VLDNTDGELFVLVEAVLVVYLLASLISKLKILLLLKLILYFEFIHVNFDLIIGTIVGGDVLFLGLLPVIYIYQLRCLSWLSGIP